MRDSAQRARKPTTAKRTERLVERSASGQSGG